MISVIEAIFGSGKDHSIFFHIQIKSSEAGTVLHIWDCLQSDL
jgi:hypothetical protein